MSGKESFKQDFEKTFAKNTKRFDDFHRKSYLLNQFQRQEFSRYGESREQYIQSASNVFKMRGEEDWNTAQFWIKTKADPIVKRIIPVFEDMLKNEYAYLKTNGEESSSIVKLLLSLQYVFLAVGILGCFGIGYIIYSTVNSSLSGISERISKEIKEITKISENLQDYSVGLSSSSTEQSSSLQETSSTMDELESIARENSKEALKSQDISNDGLETVKEGVDNILNMVKSIERIKQSNSRVTEQLKSSNDQIREISNIINNIGDKTKVINDIVFQTKLLSFNASVEAARAGEHGKGFAVVAEEVGNLASMSGKAAKEIKVMLDESIRSVTNVIEDQKREMEGLIEESTQNINSGIELGEVCENSLKSLLNKIKSLDRNVEAIAQSSEEQSRGIEEVTKSLGEISSVNMANSEVANNTKKASDSLTSTLEVFRKVVSDLLFLVRGNSHTSQNDQPRNFFDKSSASIKILKKGPTPSLRKKSPAKNSEDQGPKSHPVLTNKVAGSDIEVPSNEDPRFEKL